MIKAAVLFSCDSAQKEMLETAGKGRVEFMYIDGVRREKRLELLREAEIVFGEPGIREMLDHCMVMGALASQADRPMASRSSALVRRGSITRWILVNFQKIL